MPLPFEHHLFLSYAHVDNNAGWIGIFHDELRTVLTHRSGRRDIAVWHDAEMARNEAFEPSIQDALRRSAIFLALGSPSYFESDFCRQEHDFFAESASANLHVGNRSRVFTVLQLRQHHEEWFPHCQGHNPYRFFEGPEGARGSRLEPSSEPYKREMERLADEIIATLEEIEKANLTPPQEEPQPDRGSFRVLLTDVSDDLIPLRAKIASELNQLDIHVSIVGPPGQGDFAGLLSDADLSIHLLKRTSTRETVRQLDLALTGGGRQILWLDPKWEAEKERRAAWSRAAEAATESATCEVIQVQQRGAVRTLVERAQGLRDERTRQQRVLERRLFFDIHRNDMHHAVDLFNCLDEHDVIPLVYEDTDRPNADLPTFEEKLLQSKGLVIFFGSVGIEWVRKRLIKAIQLALVREHPMPVLGVYWAPPPKQGPSPEAGISLPIEVPVHMMNNIHGFEEATLQSLLDKLE